MKRRLVVGLVFILAVGLCGGLIWFNFFRDKMITQFFATMQQPAQTVSAAKVEAKTWSPAISAIGTAKAANGVELAFETAGIVSEIKFKANQNVRQGEVLVQLDDRVERADIQDVQANVKTAESAFERAKTLSARGYGTEANLDQASALFAAARSRLARLQATIEQKALKAPFSGVIGIPRIDVGQYLQPGTVIASFQDLSSMKVDFTVPEQRASEIKLGQEVRVGVTETDLPFKGRVIGKDPRVDPATRLVSVQALIEDNKDGAILPGQFLHVEAILPEQPNVMTLPQTAVITSLYGDYVYTIEQEERAGQQVQVVKQVFVKTGRRRGGALEILSGLNPGQQVAASGQNKLQAGSTVKIDNTIDVTKLDATKLASGRSASAMSFTELFIRRPVLSMVVSLLILLLGAQGLMNLQVRQYPEVEETTITITTAYTGASADLIQGFISTPIAKSVSSAEGVDYVTTQSRLGVSTVSVRMRLNTDPNAALTEVTSKVQQIRAQLPSEAEDPVIMKGTGQSFALMYITFGSTEMNPEQVSEFLTRVVQPRFATLEGVGNAEILGGRDFSMRVWIDPVRLAARGVTAGDVVAAIRANNFLAAPGKTQSEYVAYRLDMQTTLQTPETFGTLPIRSNGDQVVRLRDVADVELGPESTDTIVSFNGSQGTFIGIVPTPSANPLTVAEEVTKAIEGIRSTLPQGMTVEIVYDASNFISASIEEVFKTIGEAALIVVVVILLFLGSFRSVLIPIVTIPLSLVGVCFFLYALGYSINLLTLLAMVLAIGLVVDDAIVVLENIHRHIEEGLKPIDAAITGMKEIFLPIVSMTVTLAAVYAPIGFTQGLTGSLFREFAFTLAGAVIISGIVAVTLSPMMSSKLLKSHGGQGRFAAFVDRVFTRLENWYSRRLKGSLDYRGVTLVIVAVLLGTTAFMFTKTSSELAPEEDQGAYLGILNAPKYATADYTQAFSKQFTNAAEKIPEIDDSFLIVGIDGGGGGFFGFKLKEWSEREKKGAQTKQDIQNLLNENAGLQAFAFAPPSLPGAGDGLPIQYVLRTIGDSSQAYEVADEIRKRAMKSGKFIVVQNSISYESPRARITVDRDRAAALGVPVSEIGNTLGALVGGAPISKFDRDNRSYDVVSQVRQEDRLNPERLTAYYVRASDGSMVPLSALISIKTDAAPAAIEQFNQLNSATLSALPLPGVTTSEGLATLRSIAKEVMPQGFYEDYAGQSRLEIQEGNSIFLAFGLAIIVIYLVLAAQFESFRDPFIIMMSVPLSMFGAMIFLNLGLATLNIYTQVGLITLVGLITKHGILMVEFANDQKEKHGVSKREAIEEAARVRLRPILMTTAAMVLGVAPLLYASGAGAAARFSMGLVIASGMSIGTIFTLFVVPMFYTFISRETVRAHRVEDRTPEKRHHHQPVAAE